MQLSTFKGLAVYSEDFVEQAHQVGIREEARTFTMKDRDRIALIHCRNEHKRSLPSVTTIQAAVAEKSSRKRKQLVVTAKERQKEERNIKRIATINKVETEIQTYKNGRRHNLDEGRAKHAEANSNA